MTEKNGLKEIKILVLDVDGVLTDGGLVINSDGSESKIFNTHDGHGIRMCQRAGIEVVFLSGRASEPTIKRAEQLDVRRCITNCHDKLPRLEEILEESNLKAQEVAYIGDDLPDLPAIRYVGFGVATANAVDEVKAEADHITQKSGGSGAVREAIEFILKNSDRWQSVFCSIRETGLNGIDMAINTRKIKVALIAIAAIFGAYLLFRGSNKVPMVEYSQPIELAIEETNEVPLEDQVTRVGPVQVGTLQMARFSTLDPGTKQIKREFGFEKLLHEDGQQWEIDKPYMNIYRPDLTCYITASKGYVVLESDVNPPNPTDATLEGNVLARIVPTQGSDVHEGEIYLEDLVFISSESRFFTAGPVTYVADDAQMQGTGLELIYDQANDRLNLLKIKKLEYLRIKTSERYSVAGEKEDTQNAGSSQASNERVQPDPNSYMCVLSGSVIIDAQEQLIGADRVRISDIVYRESESKPKQPKDSNGIPEEAGAETADGDFVEITISCDDGIEVIPNDSAKAGQYAKEPVQDANISEALDISDSEQERTVFLTQDINYSVASRDAVATGNSVLTFYVSDFLGGDDQMRAPVTVSCDETVKFTPSNDQVIFTGNCVCSSARQESQSDILAEVSLSAPKLIVDLLGEQETSEGVLADIRRITASGEGATATRLSIVRSNYEKFLGGIEIRCPKFEFDSLNRTLIAQGPGVLKVDNSKVAVSDEAGRFDLRQPCYALVRNFKSLEYNFDTNKIVAHNDKERIYIDYFPLSQEQRQPAIMSAGTIEVELVETEAGEIKLWTLLAKDGVSMQDEDKMFEGSELILDEMRQIIRAKGSDERPAYFNGILFDGIEYDLVSGQVRDVQIRGPGFFRLGR